MGIATAISGYVLSASKEKRGGREWPTEDMIDPVESVRGYSLPPLHWACIRDLGHGCRTAGKDGGQGTERSRPPASPSSVISKPINVSAVARSKGPWAIACTRFSAPLGTISGGCCGPSPAKASPYLFVALPVYRRSVLYRMHSELLPACRGRRWYPRRKNDFFRDDQLPGAHPHGGRTPHGCCPTPTGSTGREAVPRTLRSLPATRPAQSRTLSRSRNVSHPTPPPQIRTCGITAYGSCLGS